MNLFTDVNEFIKWVESRSRFSKKVSLDNMRYFTSLFNHPENKFTSIHITGTNGKGSTVSYLKNIYLKQKLNVATFTSPYIVCFNERITYNNEFISDENLLKYANIIISKYDEIESSNHELPTFFEFITLLAFLYFADLKDLDIAIIEVGIGGRLDATNVINPICSVITNIGFDHMNQLGPTKESILNEKLGIVKNNSLFVTSIKEQNLIDIANDKCIEMNTTFKKVDFESLKIKKLDLDSSVFSYKGYKDVKINLLGKHQIENACLVIEIVENLNNYFKNKKSNFVVSNEILYEGLIVTTWPGRLECVSNDPLIYIDGGHNIDCINRVCEFVKSLNLSKTRVIVSISNDKDKAKMINIIDDTFDEIVFTKFTYQRSASSDELFELSNSNNKIMFSDILDAVKYSFDNPCEFTLFLGSLYLVSEIRPLIINQKELVNN